MSERGVFAMDRGWFDHPSFKKEPFTEREAWAWLIAEASYRPRTRRVGTIVVSLERGQLAASIRFMAQKFDWHRSRVERFLVRLKNDAMIETQNETGVLAITICNYTKYQRVSLPTETPIGIETETATRQHRDKREDTEDIEQEVIVTARGKILATWPEAWFDLFWRAYPLKVGRKKALSLLTSIRARGEVEFPRLIEAVKAYASTADPNYTAHASTWLNAGRWDDQIPQQKATPHGNRTGNPRQTGHDAILAAATRKAERLFGGNDLGGAENAPQPSPGSGIDRGGSQRDSKSSGGISADCRRDESGPGVVIEGEVIPPDKDAVGLSDGERLRCVG